jgi:hypothetical protein
MNEQLMKETRELITEARSPRSVPMTNEQRLAYYTRVLTGPETSDGYYRLTGPQRRRAEHKYRRARKRQAQA